jgi:hypothetical protein
MALTGDGKRVAFLAGSESGERIVCLGDRVLADPRGNVEWPLALTVDGGVVACQVTDPGTGKSCIAIDGRHGELYDSVGTPRLSANGSTVAYRARRGESHFVVVGTRAGPPFDFVKDPALTPGGESVAYAAARGGRWFLVVDRTELAVEAEPIDVFLGPDRDCLGWTYLELSPTGSSKARVVTRGRTGPAFDLVGRPTFSPDGSSVAYFAEEGDKHYVVVGDRATEVDGQLSDPVFSRDGTRVGYGARIGKELWWKVLTCR